MQYTLIFHGCKYDYFQMKNCDFFFVVAQNRYFLLLLLKTEIVGTR